MTLAKKYAQALHAAVAKKTGAEKRALEDAFIAVVKRRGHQRLLSQIAKAYKELSEGAGVGAKVFLARADDKAKYAKEIEEQVQGAEYVIDPQLFGGYRIETKEMLFDKSFRKGLHELYQRLTK